MHQLLTYHEAVPLVQAHLSSISNLKSYCAEHKLTYQTAVSFKGGNVEKEYPKFVTTVLSLMGYEVTQKKLTMFCIKKQ